MIVIECGGFLGSGLLEAAEEVARVAAGHPRRAWTGALPPSVMEGWRMRNKEEEEFDV